MRNALLRAAPLALALAACSGGSGGGALPPPTGGGRPVPVEDGKSTAFEVDRAERLVGGASALGGVGDFILGNEHVWALIQKTGPSIGFVGAFGGDVLDAGRNVPVAEGGGDLLSEIFPIFLHLLPEPPFLNPRGAEPLAIEVADDGSSGGPAVVRVTGRDGFANILGAFFPDLDVADVSAGLTFTTDYILEPAVRVLRIETNLRNAGDKPAGFIGVGDVLLFGSDLRVLAPGFGFDDEDDLPDLITVPYFVADGEGVSYGYLAQSELFVPTVDASQTGGIFDLIFAELQPGEERMLARSVIIAEGDAASVEEEVLALQGSPVGRVSGRVTDAGGEPVSGAFVRIADEGGKPRSEAETDAAGDYEAALAPGAYTLTAKAFGRADSAPAPVALAEGDEKTVDLALSASGRLAFTVRESTLPGNPLTPATLIVQGLDGGALDPARDPNLGFEGRSQAGNRIYTLEGSGEVRLPVGAYRVTAGRGIEYAQQAIDVEIAEGETAHADFSVARAVDTAGWISADFHVHSSNSDDSPTPLEDRVGSFAGVGIEFLAATDHDFITDYRPAIERLGAEKYVATTSGEEISTLTMGHFNGFPLERNPDVGDFGALDWRGKTAGEIYDWIASHPGDQAVMMNHPRSALKGHLDFLQYDPATGGVAPGRTLFTNFNAIEVNLETKVRADWFSFLNQGIVVTGVGNSDTHRTFQGGPGFPVNYLRVQDDAPESVSEGEIVDALLAHRASFTSGPFVEAEAGGEPIGSTVLDTDGTARLHIRVQAAPWVGVSVIEVFANGASAMTIPVAASEDAVRYDDSVDLAVAQDAWVVVEVRGAAFASPFASGAPRAMTNPIWIDADGGGFTPPGL